MKFVNEGKRYTDREAQNEKENKTNYRKYNSFTSSLIYIATINNQITEVLKIG